MASHRQTIVGVVLLAGIFSLVLLGRFMTFGGDPLKVLEKDRIDGVMSTTGSFVAAVPADQKDLAREAFRRARQAAFDVERLMSSQMEGTEISLLNQAEADQLISLSPETLEVLQTARSLHAETQGAFDVTVRPIIEVWKTAASEDRLPGEDELAAARQASNWQQLDLGPHNAVKQVPTVSVDLGGIAKGYAIDQAVRAMREAGVRGGIVEIGGDLRCFGVRHDDRNWRVDIVDPFAPDKPLLQIEVDTSKAGAVCTSGNYRRGVKIANQWFSHIIDPRTGWPVEAAPSVTVVAPTAMIADGWATALSVLGPDGMSLIPQDQSIEAMLVTGTPDDHEVVMTPGFEKMVISRKQPVTTQASMSR